MHDPRTPEILTWLDAMPIAKRAIFSPRLAAEFCGDSGAQFD